jgi:hypothetical protein
MRESAYFDYCRNMGYSQRPKKAKVLINALFQVDLIGFHLSGRIAGRANADTSPAGADRRRSFNWGSLAAVASWALERSQ